MNHAIRHHKHYAKAALAFRRDMNGMPAMRYFRQRMQHAFEDVYGPEVTVPPMDVLAKGMATDFSKEIPSRLPNAEERELIRGLVYHREKDVTELMDDYANWSRVAWRAFDAAFAREFGEATPAYTNDDHLRLLRQANHVGDEQHIEQTMNDIARVANGSVARTSQRLDAKKTTHNKAHEKTYNLPKGMLKDADKEFHVRLQRKLVDHEETLCDRWYTGLWELMFDKENHAYDKLFPEDVLAYMNTSLMAQSPEVGQFYPDPELGMNMEYPHVVGQAAKVPEDVKDMAAGVIILRQACASMEIIAQRLLHERASMRRGSFGDKERAALAKEFKATYYDEMLYHREPYVPTQAMPTEQAKRPTHTMEAVSLSEWLSHLTHDHVHDHSMRVHVMEEVSHMQELALEELLDHCERRINGVNAKAKREVG